MNRTLWSSTEEAIGHFFLGGILVGLYSYAIFLCYAVYDYQDEKPPAEKSSLDILMKDLMNAQFYLLYYIGLIQFISLFSPPITGSDIIYWLSHFCIFISNFQGVSCIMFLYIQHVYVFQPDDFKISQVSSMRHKSLLWKFSLTMIAISLSILVPIEREPIIFLILTKGTDYNR